ncbi:MULTISPECIES: hypothetical protein [unclassified Tolypothrix]|uniref:hypothetical protein n=1 Tax=unclassified Tolypothrix TaxID=2649714 RepID=UPI0005F893F1|nr:MULTISPECIES: hypothetical protein [unclassified Tolypothrix]MBE9084485.1 hypothetical protein [Tolypothrix sp. LEGE 11397]UYD23449.1 hypothetical protein HGR01_18115 [Tolypothrix sp. PCC 7712]UYD34320.1 hypothetical protein HG267_00160 [Tolypothrix sp. PCC 7601]BAY89150.1 hypothetical protein NIES3275_11530 [Microchaete diplosiphon NIES-3275]
MSQNLPIDSRTQSSKTPGLKPGLASALASLEVQLDQELARYRRTRDTSRLANPRVVSYIGSTPQAIAQAILEQSQSTDIKSPTPPAPVTPDPLLEAATDTVRFEELDHLQLSSTPEVATTLTPPPPPPPVPPTPASSIVRTEPPDEDDTVLQSDDPPSEPDNYLESSEALLRSVTDEESPAKRPSTANDGILSPLGIGSMLLLLVASLTLGYVVFNPKSLTQLKLSNVFNGKSSAPAENTANVETNIQAPPETLLTPIPKYPNLAAKEFPEVKDPNDVIGLTPKGKANPAPLPNQIPVQPVQPPAGLSAPQPANPTAAAPVQTIEPAAPINSPAPSPNAAPFQLNPQTKPSADGFYHVVTDNQNERSFAAARQVIPDAYLSKDNKLIFLGAFKTQKEVKKHLELLQKRGIPARVE